MNRKLNDESKSLVTINISILNDGAIAMQMMKITNTATAMLLATITRKGR